MAIKVVSLISIFTIILVLSKNINSLETNFLKVPLDHFVFTEEPNNFLLRYLIENKYHIKEGPIFVYMGQHEDINLSAGNTGFLFEIAPIFNALIVFVEHRYYGKSLPFGNETFKSPENMKYLTTSQVLADLANVVTHIKLKYSNNDEQDSNRVIVFGANYGGTLAVWFRMKYPYLTQGAIASSASFVYPQNPKNCGKFYKKVTEVFEANGQKKCIKTIKMSWEIMLNMSKSKLGMDFISSTLKLCTPMNSADDVEKLINWLSNIYVKLASFNYHYPTKYYTPLPAFPVKIFCDKITTSSYNDTKGLLEHLGRSITVYTNYTGKTVCNDFRGFFEDPAEFAWNYQSCTELITPKCSTSSDMFMSHQWNAEKFSFYCYKNFRTKTGFTDMPLINYGGRKFKFYSNIVFINGLNDPWSVTGVLFNVSSTISAYNIIDAPHQIDLRASDNTDNNYITNARNYYVKVLKKWLTISDKI